MKNYQTILATLSLGSLLATGTAHAQSEPPVWGPSVCESYHTPAVVMQGSIFNLFSLENDGANGSYTVSHWYSCDVPGEGGLCLEFLGGDTLYAAGATSWDANNMDLFVTGTDNAVWNRHYCAAECVGITGWGPWVSLGADSVSAPIAWSSGPGILDVIVVGTDGGMWDDHWDSRVGSWTGWELTPFH